MRAPAHTGTWNSSVGIQQRCCGRPPGPGPTRIHTPALSSHLVPLRLRLRARVVGRANLVGWRGPIGGGRPAVAAGLTRRSRRAALENGCSVVSLARAVVPGECWERGGLEKGGSLPGRQQRWRCCCLWWRRNRRVEPARIEDVQHVHRFSGPRAPGDLCLTFCASNATSSSAPPHHHHNWCVEWARRERDPRRARGAGALWPGNAGLGSNGRFAPGCRPGAGRQGRWRSVRRGRGDCRGGGLNGAMGGAEGNGAPRVPNGKWWRGVATRSNSSSCCRSRSSDSAAPASPGRALGPVLLATLEKLEMADVRADTLLCTSVHTHARARRAGWRCAWRWA